MSTELAIAFIGVCGVITAAIIKMPWSKALPSRRNGDKNVTDDLCKERRVTTDQKIDGLERKVDSGFADTKESLNRIFTKINNGV